MSVLELNYPSDHDFTRPRPVGLLGRLPAVLPIQMGWLDKYITPKAAPASVTRQQFVTIVWGMLGNDQYGDCTFAAWVHLVMAVAALLGVQITVPQAAQVIKDYLTFTHGVDSGCVESSVLQTTVSTGLCGFTAAGYVASKGPLEELLWIVSEFGAGYLGGMLTASDQQAFANHEPWSLGSDKTIIGGHAFPIVEYDKSTAMAKVITWGAEQLVTFDWLEARVDEKWAVIPEQVKTAGTLDGFDWAQLEADMASLPGAVFA